MVLVAAEASVRRRSLLIATRQRQREVFEA